MAKTLNAWFYKISFKSSESSGRHGTYFVDVILLIQ